LLAKVNIFSNNHYKFMTNKRFKVALSFPGEQRDYVLQVAELLASELGGEHTVFYDNWYEEELAISNLDIRLQKIYHDDAQLIVTFLCADYKRKEWCGLEWRAIRDLIKKRKDDDMMFLRFDNADISGLFSIDGYIDLRNRSPEETVELIIKRLKRIGYFVENNNASINTAPKIIIENNPIITPTIEPYQDWQRIGKYKVKDGLAIDTETNLMWLRFTYGQQWQNNTAQGEAIEVNWQTAFEVAKEFNKNSGYANYSDWRLPTIDELKTLINKEKGKQGNYIDADVFPNNAHRCWSSSPVADNRFGAWIVYFGNGYDSWDFKNSDNFVRLVRAGQ
jgi:hypothetical protein